MSVAQLEQIVTELTRVVYLHAGTIAETKREFGVHYHKEEGKTIPIVLRTQDLFFDQVRRLSATSLAIEHDPTPEIMEYERDPEAFLKSNYSDLFFWPWE